MNCGRRCDGPPARLAIRWRWRQQPPPSGSSRFCPPDYRGLSELGLIAGCGMLIAFLCSITLVPAMVALLNPAGEAAAVGFRSLAPLDAFLQRHRIAVIVGTILVVLAGMPLLLHLPFDFNPVNLQAPNSPSVVDLPRTAAAIRKPPATMRKCWRPRSNRPTPTARRLAALPEVSARPDAEQFYPRPSRTRRSPP